MITGKDQSHDHWQTMYHIIAIPVPDSSDFESGQLHAPFMYCLINSALTGLCAEPNGTELSRLSI